MEYQIKLKNNNGLYLAGILNSPDTSSTVGIIFLHGFAGDKDENGLFSYAANIISKNGYHTLRFDFTGAGKSQGEYSQSTLESQKNDFICALDFFIKKCSLNKVGVIGFSLGATIALLGYNERINAMSLWSPALFPKVDMFPRYQSNEVKSQLEGYGYIKKAGLKVGEKIIKDLDRYDLVPYIKTVACSVLLTHGNKDERIDYKNTLKAEDMFKIAERFIVEDVGHSYKESFKAKEEVINKTMAFFDKTILPRIPVRNSV